MNDCENDTITEYISNSEIHHYSLTSKYQFRLNQNLKLIGNFFVGLKIPHKQDIFANAHRSTRSAIHSTTGEAFA